MRDIARPNGAQSLKNEHFHTQILSHMDDFWKKADDMAKETLDKAAEAAGKAAAVAAEKLGELKEAASEKLSELSEKAEAMAAEAKAEAEKKAAEAQAAKEKIAAHADGALGYLSDKAKEIFGEGDVEPGDEGEAKKEEPPRDFWDKAADFGK